MIFTSLHPRLCPSIRESRLLGRTIDNRPNNNNLPGINGLQNVVDKTTKLAKDYIFSREEAKERDTAEKLRNPRLWIAAFRREGIFRTEKTAELPAVQQLARNILKEEAYGPDRLLETMSVAERRDMFETFIRDVLPPDVAAQVLAAPRDGAKEDAWKESALITAEITLGFKMDPAQGNAKEFLLARQALDTIYPPKDFGHSYEDYRGLCNKLREIPGPGGQVLTTDDLRDRTRLLKLIDERSRGPAPRIGTAPYLRFAGWLRTVANPAEAQLKLNALNDQLKSDELKEDVVSQKNNLLLEKLQKGPRQDIERRNTTFMQNFDGLESWQKFAVVGLGLWAATKLWRKPGRFLKIIPYWMFPTALVGTVLYRKMMLGDKEATNTVMNWTQEKGNMLYDAGMGVFRRTGNLTMEEEDQQRMQLMIETFGQRKVETRTPVGAAAMVLAEVEMQYLAGTSYRTEIRNGKLRFNLFSPRREETPEDRFVASRPPPKRAKNWEPQAYPRATTNLYKRVQGIVDKRKYDKNIVHEIFENPVNNEEVAKAIAFSVFLPLAAELPENRAKMKRIDAVRRSSAVIVNGIPTLSYDNITDPAALKDLYDMIQQGRNLAVAKYPNESFVGMIGRFHEGPEKIERIENAERIDDDKLFRPAEKALLDVKKQPLVPDRAESIKLIRAEFEEFIADSSKDPFRIIGADAKPTLKNFLNDILARNDSLPDIMQLLGKVRYAILLGAMKRTTGSPLSRADMEEIVGTRDEPAGASDIPMWTSKITNWINRELVTVASSFQTVQSMANVEALLSDRLFKDINAPEGGLQLLREEIIKRKGQFDLLRRPDQAARLLAASLDAATIARFGGRPAAETFLARLTETAEYKTFVNDYEKHAAQYITNEIVIARIGIHKKNGEHVLDANPEDRFITKAEEQNLIRKLTGILGPDTRPLNNAFSGMAMRQLLKDFQAEDVNDVNIFNDAIQKRTGEYVRRLSFLYTGLQPMQPSVTTREVRIWGDARVNVQVDRMDSEVRARVLSMAEKFVKLWITRGIGGKDELRKMPEFMKTVQDILDTMKLLDINPVYATTGRKLQQEMYEILHGEPRPASERPGPSPVEVSMGLTPGPSGTIDYLVPGTGPIALRLTPGPNGKMDLKLTPGPSPVQISAAPGADNGLDLTPGAGVRFDIVPGPAGSVTVPAGPGVVLTFSPGPNGQVEAPGQGEITFLRPGPGGSFELIPGPGNVNLPSSASTYLNVALHPGSAPVRVTPGSTAGSVRLMPTPGDLAFQITAGADGSVKIPATPGRAEIVFNPGPGGTVTEVPGSGGIVELTPARGKTVNAVPEGRPSVAFGPGATPGTFTLDAGAGNPLPAIEQGPSGSIVLNPNGGRDAIRITPDSGGRIDPVAGTRDLRLKPGLSGKVNMQMSTAADTVLSMTVSPASLAFSPPAGVAAVIDAAAAGGATLTITPANGVATTLKVGAGGRIEQAGAGQITITPDATGIAMDTAGGVVKEKLVLEAGGTLLLRHGA